MAYFPPALSGFERSRTYVQRSGDTTGANDRARINAALAKGGRVELGAGDLYLDSALILNQDKQQLVGQGRGVTRLNFVGDMTLHNIILASKAATTSNDGLAAPIAPATVLSDILIRGMSLIGNSDYTAALPSEQVGMPVYAIGTQRATIDNLFISQFNGFGVNVRSGSADGSQPSRSQDNHVNDVIVQMDGRLGFYDDSVNSFLSNPKFNRNNSFVECSGYRTSKYAAASTPGDEAVLHAWGTYGTKFVACHGEGMQVSDNSSDMAAIRLSGAAFGTQIIGCSSLECRDGLVLADCGGTTVVDFNSLFDARNGILLGKVNDITIIDPRLYDFGLAAITLGMGIRLAPGYAGGTLASRIKIAGGIFGSSGFATGPIYGIGPNMNSCIFFDGTDDVLVSDCMQNTGVGIGNYFSFTAAADRLKLRIHRFRQFNPVGIIATPFDNTNSYVGTLGPGALAATPTSTTVYTCILTPLDIFWTGGTVTAQTRNATAIPQVAASPNFVHLEPGDTYSITFSVVPTTFRVYGH